VAAYALVTENTRILLCRLSRTAGSGAGKWTLPGGGIDFGETPEFAVVREVREETGLEVELNGLLAAHSTVYKFDDVHLHHLWIIYRAEYRAGELRSELDGSTDLAGWFTVSEAKALPIVDLVEYTLEKAFPGAK
jgi:8-oxo-dGTP diphosphatase